VSAGVASERQDPATAVRPDDQVLATGPTLRLRRLAAADLPVVHELMSAPEIGRTWRARGAVLAPTQVQGLLTRDVLVSAVAERRDDGRLVGLTEVLDPSFVDRRAQLSAFVASDLLSTGISVEMGLLFLDWFFEAYAIDKVQLEVLGSNHRLVPGLRRLVHHEGTLVRHVNLLGRWEDVEVFAVWREDLPGLCSMLLPRTLGSEEVIDVRG
jgi:RimJ/RimL family protein N-acetyltransferase